MSNNSDDESYYDDHEDMEAFRETVAERYCFYVTEHTDEDDETVAESFSLYYRGEHGEFPLLQNTGGRDVINSAIVHTSGGEHTDALPASEEFVDSVAYCLHEALCFMGPDGEQMVSTMEAMYDVEDVDDIPRHEAWAIPILVSEMFIGKVRPEMEMLAEYANCCTEFGVPEPMESDYESPE